MLDCGLNAIILGPFLHHFLMVPLVGTTLESFNYYRGGYGVGLPPDLDPLSLWFEVRYEF